jgi:hypothetical protein
MILRYLYSIQFNFIIFIKINKKGAGPDPAWGNWLWGVSSPTCTIPTTTPNTCNEGTSFTYAFPNEQRNVASKRRPLAGIYSASARDAEGTIRGREKTKETFDQYKLFFPFLFFIFLLFLFILLPLFFCLGLARVDLMLSHLRRPCDGGANARLDAWAVQQNSIYGSSKYLKSLIKIFIYKMKRRKEVNIIHLPFLYIVIYLFKIGTKLKALPTTVRLVTCRTVRCLLFSNKLKVQVC